MFGISVSPPFSAISAQGAGMPGGGNNSTHGLKDRTKNGFVQLSLRNASGEAMR